MYEEYLLVFEAQYLSSFLIFQKLKMKVHRHLQVSVKSADLSCGTNKSCMRLFCVHCLFESKRTVRKVNKPAQVRYPHFTLPENWFFRLKFCL